MTETKDAPAGAAPMPDAPAAAAPAPAQAGPRLLKIQEAAAESGLTPRSVRYYEEQGLLRPAARSQGDYRLYDESDVERLRFIKGLRDVAGFSIAEIGKLLEDEVARERGHEAYHATTDVAARLRILRDRADRYRQQIELLRSKIGLLETMAGEAEDRLARTNGKIEALAAELGEGAGADGLSR
jgi:DNA-binding transcriptional MerR regulator